jgi:TusA-related sulfurtransferase
MEVAKKLDCKAQICPEPILNMKLAMNEVNSGEIVQMEATDKGSVSDMASWSKRTGHEIVDQKQEGEVFTFFVKKK